MRIAIAAGSVASDRQGDNRACEPHESGQGSCDHGAPVDAVHLMVPFMFQGSIVRTLAVVAMSPTDSPTPSDQQNRQIEEQPRFKLALRLADSGLHLAHVASPRIDDCLSLRKEG